MSEQELWDKFIEMYRDVWCQEAEDREGIPSRIYSNISGLTHWQIFDEDYAMGHSTMHDVHLTRRNYPLLSKHPRWELLINTPAWPYIEQLFPETAVIRLLYV